MAELHKDFENYLDKMDGDLLKVFEGVGKQTVNNWKDKFIDGDRMGPTIFIMLVMYVGAYEKLETTASQIEDKYYLDDDATYTEDELKLRFTEFRKHARELGTLLVQHIQHDIDDFEKYDF